MTKNQFEEFSFLWKSDPNKYVIFNPNSSSEESKYFIIIDTESNAAELIEDPELATEVIQHMINAGVEIVHRLPNRG